MGTKGSDVDLQDPVHCLAFALRRAGRRVSAAYDEALRGTGLRATQFNLMVLLSRAGPVRIGRLAELSGTDRTTLTRNLRVLEGRQLISFSAGTDRRERRVTLSSKGRGALEGALPAWAEAQRSLAGSMRGDPFDLLTALADVEDAAS